jgi:hypothetical protein
MKSSTDILQRLKSDSSQNELSNLKLTKVKLPLSTEKIILDNLVERLYDDLKLSKYVDTVKPQNKEIITDPNSVCDLIKSTSEVIQQLQDENQKLCKENQGLYEKNLELNGENQYLKKNHVLQKNEQDFSQDLSDQDSLLKEVALRSTAEKNQVLHKGLLKKLREEHQKLTKETQSEEAQEKLPKKLADPIELLTAKNQQLSDENQYLNKNNQYLKEATRILKKFIQENLELDKTYLIKENQKLQEENKRLDGENQQLQEAVTQGTSLINTLTSELEQAKENLNDLQELHNNLTQIKGDNQILMEWLGYEGEKLANLEKSNTLKTDSNCDPDLDSDSNNSSYVSLP